MCVYMRVSVCLSVLVSVTRYVGRRGLVLSTVHLQLSRVDHTQRLAMCTVSWATGRDGVARVRGR